MGTTRRFVFALCALAWCSLSVAARPAIRDAINEPGEDWQASFGPELQRGNAKAEFALVDAKGQKLELAELREARLLRNVGPYKWNEGCRFEGSRLICDGVSRVGLEPGEYELEVGLGAYGLIKHAFSLKRGERVNSTLKTEVWRRLIKLRFEDENGQTIASLPDEPGYTWPRSRIEPKTFYGPGKILRDAPVRDRPDMGGGGGRGGAGGFAYRRAKKPENARWDTDGGYWHFRVFAGCKSKIVCKLGDSLGQEKLEIESTFEGSEWDERVVALKPGETYAADMAKRKSANESDPGDKSILTATFGEPKALGDPNDKSTLKEGFQRLIVSIDAPFAITPKGLVSARDSNDVWPEYEFVGQDSRWWIDFPKGRQVKLQWRSPKLLTDTWKWETAPLSEDPVSEFSRKFELCTLSVDWPCATAKAGTALVSIGVGRCWNGWEAVAQPATDSMLFYIQRADIPADSAKVDVAIQCRWPNSREYVGMGGPRAEFELDKESLAKLHSGSLNLRPSWHGLLWRSVGGKGEGLPWVEASLMTESDAEIAIRVRKKWMKHRADCVKANPDYIPNLEAERIRMEELTTDTELYQHIYDKGAWYNPFAKSRNEDQGFGWMDASLEEGKRYALFLWSNSRDELKPDKRIDFVATGQMMDLGLITLPSYSK